MTVKKSSKKSGQVLELTRRDFIKTSTAAGTVVALAPYEKAVAQLHNAGAFWKRRSGSAPAIGNSLRLRSSVSARLSRVNGVPTSTTKGTIFGWIKRGKLSSSQGLLGCSATYETLTLLSTDDLYVQTNSRCRITSRVFRDPSAWMPFVFTFNTANTAGGIPKQQRLWINMVEQTNFSTDQDASGLLPPQWFVNTVTQYIGYSQNSGQYYDGYVAGVGFVDGQELDCNVNAKLDTNGYIVPKTSAEVRTAVAAGGGARNGWGAQGSFLIFNDATSTTTLCYDRSQSDTDTTGNNWTATNVNTYDQVVDSPSNNFCTLNPLKAISAPNAGGLSLPTVAQNVIHPTFALGSGKWYAEFTASAASAGSSCGVTVRPAWAPAVDINNLNSYDSTYYRNDGSLIENASTVAPYTDWSFAAHTIGVALDMDSGTRTAKWYYDGVLQGSRNLIDQTSDYVISAYQ